MNKLMVIIHRMTRITMKQSEHNDYNWDVIFEISIKRMLEAINESKDFDTRKKSQ